MKLRVFNNIPSEYRQDLFREMKEIHVEFDVRYLSKSETVRDWEVKINPLYERVLPSIYQVRNKATTTSDRIFNFNYYKDSVEADVVIYFGYNYFTYLISALFRKIKGKTNILFCESTFMDKTRKEGGKDLVKGILIKSLFSSYLVPGVRSLEYLKGLGVDSSHIEIAVNASSLRPSAPVRPELKNKLHLLYVGRLSEEKNIVSAVRFLKESDDGFQLKIAGSGVCDAQIRELTRDDDRFVLLGHLTSDELCKEYTCNDVLLLPSKSEAWGLVVNEAVNFGLAALLSKHVGCCPELVKGNGETFDPDSKDDFFKAYEGVKARLLAYRKSSLELAKEYTIKNQAEVMVKHALARGRI